MWLGRHGLVSRNLGLRPSARACSTYGGSRAVRLVLHRQPATLFDYTYDDIEFADYQYHPALKAPVAV